MRIRSFHEKKIWIYRSAVKALKKRQRLVYSNSSVKNLNFFTFFVTFSATPAVDPHPWCGSGSAFLPLNSSVSENIKISVFVQFLCLTKIGFGKYILFRVSGRVADPHSFHPDPAF